MAQNDPADIAALTEVFKGPQPEGRNTTIRFSNKGNLVVDTEAAKALAAAMSSNSWVEQVNFNGTGFGAAYEQILPALCDSKQIYSLNLGRGYLDNRHVIYLARAIEAKLPVRLDIVTVADNALGEAGVEQLVEAFNRLPAEPRKLLLANNVPCPLSERAVEALVKLRARAADVVFGAGPAGRMLEARVAMAAIENDALKRQVNMKQAEVRASDCLLALS